MIQRLLVRLMICSLLMVTGVPMSASAKIFDMGNFVSDNAISDSMQHTMDHPMHDDNCVIECGCGCHHSIDSLPSLLAPHMPATALFNTADHQFLTIEETSLALTTIPAVTPSPPPRKA